MHIGFRNTSVAFLLVQFLSYWLLSEAELDIVFSCSNKVARERLKQVVMQGGEKDISELSSDSPINNEHSSK